ncbi:aryl-alcohol-oxidase from pleurotus Eryingii [Panus rudis PR-1116 ss-1]|nr:aryl-alcohol-oxidase from pleurotus Eryingii [Panus rudis PR-1116 ss-1]
MILHPLLIALVHTTFLLGFSGAKILNSPSELTKKTYDFVIVGGGTAGSVLASRLSENSKVSVLVIEAGINNEGILNVEVPFLGVTLPGTSVDWNFTTTPQSGLGGRVLPYTRGFVLGGSSSVNLLTYHRGSDDVWNRWASLTNDQGWSWNSVQQYYLKSSKLVPPADGHDFTGEANPAVHGNGPVDVSVPGFPLPIDDIVVNSSQELGGRFQFNLDFNAGNFVGVGFMQSTIGGGERSSAATAYLEPVETRSNLDILINTRVTKLVKTGTSKSGPIFKAVEIGQPGSSDRTQINANNEIILSAGVIGTPQVLLLSGIGPSSALNSVGIQTIINNPDVGQNLADHPLVPNYYQVSSNGTWDDVLRNNDLFGQTLGQWTSSHTGLFVDSPGNTLAFNRLPPDSPALAGTADPAAGPKSPHTELIFVDGFAPFGTVAQPATGNFISVLTAVVSPTSRGSVTLASSDPFAKPVINPAVLTSNFDIQAMVQAIKDAQTFLAASPWQAQFKPVPFGDLAAATTDDAKADFARKNSVTVNHPAGTARMSPANANWGVVDSNLNLKGAQGVRIVDASIFPAIPECHIQGPVYVVAERAADLIKSAYGL